MKSLILIAAALITTTVFANESCRMQSLEQTKQAIHNRVDQFSPYKLSQHESDNTFDKIADLTLAQLSVTFADTLWAHVNADLVNCGYKAISIRNQKAAQSPKEILSLVQAKMKNDAQVVFSRENRFQDSGTTYDVKTNVTISID